MSYDFSTAANSMNELWMPFTPMRYFKKEPRIVVRSEGMYYYDTEGKKILDGIAGLWCVNAGHNNPRVKSAIIAQLDDLDFASNFQYGHPTAFKAASRLCAAMPEGYNNVFFSNSGSEAVETALKIALAYHHARGEDSRRILIGRERGYHGVNFGGISVGGIPYLKKAFGTLLPNVDHLPQTQDLEKNAFVRGMPEWGACLADDLENKVKKHGADKIAAVIVEPVAGSTGILPPPKGYLERLREICDEHGILLIFDEVVTGFGRLGAISSVDIFGVRPDIITMAKGLSNGTVPAGATFVTEDIYNTFMDGPEEVIEFMHGYTYSGHPLATAAIIGTLDALQDDNILDNAKKMCQPLEDAVHDLRDKPRVIDIRNIGVMAAIELEEYSEEDPSKFARDASWELFRRGMMVRYSGANLQICPPLIVDEGHIYNITAAVGEVLDDLAA
jgi:beta-alanine--pyruvate transaminase